MKKLLKLLILIMVCACNPIHFEQQESKSFNKVNSIKPFELLVIKSDYSMGSSLTYKLTEEKLTIVRGGDIEGEKDTIIFSAALNQTDSFEKISYSKLANLKAYYANCFIMDGSQILVKVIQENKSKAVQLSNYYVEEVGQIITLVNSLAPKKYQIWYDKETLLKKLNGCKIELEE